MLEVVDSNDVADLDAFDAHPVEDGLGIGIGHAEPFQFCAFPDIVNDIAFGYKDVLLNGHVEFCVHLLSPRRTDLVAIIAYIFGKYK